MKRKLIFILLLLCILFCNGCSLFLNKNFEIDQVQSYVVEIGDTLPFTNIQFDESKHILEHTALGVYATNIGEIIIKTDQGNYYVIVKAESPKIHANCNQLLLVGDQETIVASISPASYTLPLSYKSLDDSIVKVDENGVVTGVSEGVTRVIVSNSFLNIETELTFFVLSEDEKQYEAIVNLIINNNELVLDNSFNGLIQGIMQKNTMSLIGVSTYELKKNKLVESDFGSGIIYKMNIYYSDGKIEENVTDISNKTDIKKFEYYVITNRHLIQGKTKVKVYIGEDYPSIDATVMEYDDKIDLAVLKFESKYFFPVAKIGDSELIDNGEFIISIGHGTGKEYYKSATLGVISSTKRYVNSDTNGDGINDWDSEYIQHDAAINDCDSGGAILNLKGEIIGINSTRISSITFNNMSFAIPINLVMEIVKQLEVGQRPKRAVLGVQILDLTGYWQSPEIYQQQYPGINIPEHIKHGFYVSVVEKGGVAEKAKVQVGDIILEFNNVEIRYSYQVRAELGKFLIGSGQIAEIKVYRNGEVVTLYCEF